MNLLVASALGLCTYYLLGKAVVPAVEKAKWSKGKLPELTKVGVIAVLNTLRKMSGVLAVTYAVVWTVNGAYGLYLEATVADNERSLGLWMGTIAAADWIQGIKGWQWFWTLLVLLTVFCVAAYRNGVQRAQEAYNAVKERQAAGRLEDLPPDASMEEISKWMKSLGEERDRLRGIPDARLSPEERDLKAERLQQYDQLLRAARHLRTEQDARRRITAELDERGKAKQGKKPNRLLTALGSRGMLAWLDHTGGFLSKASTVLLSLSFIMADNARIGGALAETGRGIPELVAQRSKQELDERWARSMAGIPNDALQTEWTAEDEEVLDGMASDLENALAEAYAQGEGYQDAAANFHLRSGALRSSILRAYGPSSGRTSAAHFTASRMGEGLAGSDDPANRVAQRFADAQNRSGSRKPATVVGEQCRNDLKKRYARSTTAWQRAKASYLKTVTELTDFTTPAQPKEVLSRLVNEAMGKASGEALDLIDELGGQPTFEREVAKKSVSKFNDAFWRKHVEAKVAAFTDDLNSTVDYSQSLRRCATTATSTDKVVTATLAEVELPRLSDVNERMRTYAPALDHTPYTAERLASQEGAIRNLARTAQVETRLVSDASLSYRYLFPGQPGAEAGEAAARLTAEVVEHASHFSAGGGGGGSNFAKTAARSRSYRALRGFRRIGGVLIGDEPGNTGNTGVDTRDITWTISGNSIEIFLHDAAGQKRSAGTYDADIAHQALVYAADGRPITVTMVSARPMPALKVLTHAALVDTRLGCQAIALDRFVDEHATSKSPEMAKLIRRYVYQEALYKLACMKRLGKPTDFSERLEYMFRWDEIAAALDHGEVLRDPKRSHIAANPRLYDRNVVNDLIQALAGANGEFSTFEELLPGKDFGATEDELFKVSTDLWSGVRERPYRIDPDLAFLKPQGTIGCEPLYFVEQVALSPLTDDIPEQWTEKPWEFEELTKGDRLSGIVVKGVRARADQALILERMRYFTLAQRLFRAALNGDLGYQFPVEKLQALLAATAYGVQPAETPTWSRPVSEADLRGITEEFDEETREAFMEVARSSGVLDDRNKRPCR